MSRQPFTTSTIVPALLYVGIMQQRSDCSNLYGELHFSIFFFVVENGCLEYVVCLLNRNIYCMSCLRNDKISELYHLYVADNHIANIFLQLYYPHNTLFAYLQQNDSRSDRVIREMSFIYDMLRVKTDLCRVAVSTLLKR